MARGVVDPHRIQYPRIIRPLVPMFGRDINGSNRFPFYVNPKAPSATDIGGDDGRDGLSVESAFRTMQKAIDSCLDNVGDRIIRLRGTETVTETINFNKSGIVVRAMDLGISREALGEEFAILADAAFTDGPVATITATCRIEGLGFVSRDTGATFFSGAAMLIGGLATALPFGVHIKNCRFPKWGVSNRIGIGVEGTTDLTIEGCTFEGVAADFDSGIYVQGACQNINILRNKFRQCTFAIVHGAFPGSGPECLYGHNVIEDNKFLDANGNAATGLIYDNWMAGATDTGSYDASLVTNRALGLEFTGNHYIEA